MRFSKIKKKKVTESVFKLFLKNLVSKGLFAACTVAMVTVGILHKPLSKLYANRFMQMTKHRSCDRDNSVVIFFRWTHSVSRGKPYRVSLSFIVVFRFDLVLFLSLIMNW